MVDRSHLAKYFEILLYLIESNKEFAHLAFIDQFHPCQKVKKIQ